MKDFISGTWNAISAPPKTPDAIIAKLSAATTEALQSQEVSARFKDLHLQTETMTPKQAKAFIEADAKRWADVIRTANIKPE